MSDLLDILMKDPAVKKEMVLRAKKAIKDIVFTKQDIIKIKIAVMDSIIEISDLSNEDDDVYYEIRKVLAKEMKKVIINKFKEK